MNAILNDKINIAKAVNEVISLKDAPMLNLVEQPCNRSAWNDSLVILTCVISNTSTF
jgi:hypothetical protein